MDKTRIDFNFRRYVNERKRADVITDTAGLARYAFAGDRKYLGYMRRVKPVALAIEATVRAWKSFARSDLLGSSVRVSGQQFAEIDRLVERCATRLGIAKPDVYVIQQLGALNASTYGTDEDAFIQINSAAIDHLDEAELLYVIGHECGHVHNSHVVFLTAAHYLGSVASMFVRWIVTPAMLVLNAWNRRAEITADRAGLLCSGDLAGATRALLKFALGSKKLYEEINIEEYMKQLEEVRGEVGRMSELLRTHPYLPKRVQALRLFAKSRYYRETVLQEEGGMELSEVDSRVAELLSAR